MPSAFPGMDPYLEAPEIWPDLHDALANEIRGWLNQRLPAPYYARVEMRPEVGIVEDAAISRRIIPDVAVARLPQVPATQTKVAVLEAPRSITQQQHEVIVFLDPFRHKLVEIRDPSRGHELVTLIEIVSPANKLPGPDRRAYLQKQQEILQSQTSLVELDLLREGQRLLPHRELEQAVQQMSPVPEYLVLINRAWKRTGPSTAFDLIPVLVTEPLPCIPVPLRQGQPEVPLDLQVVFTRAYESGPYARGAVDYEQPLQPPLRAELASWVEQLVRARS